MMSGCKPTNSFANALWGDQAAPQDAVHLDLYDDYLDPA
jgi:hypothetical protein